MTLEEIYTMPAPELKRHVRMARAKRAAQFMPFSALAGYEEELQEESRRTEDFIELDEYEKEEINRVLTALIATIGEKPGARICYFMPDAKKAGGSYVTVRGRLHKHCVHKRVLLLDDDTEIPIDAIYSIEEVKKICT